MNYIKQINTFYKLLPNNPLSSNAQCLYVYLLNKNNELGWIKEFTVSNLIVCGMTGLNRQSMDRARNELKQKGYIEYKKGISNHAGRYLIVEFDTQDNTQDDTQEDTQDDTQNGHKVSTLNKLNKTKQKNKKKINKKKFGEYENVKLDDEQYLKLVNDFPQDYKSRIQNLDDYIQMHGDKYKDHLATIRAWARKEGYKKPKKIESNVEYKEINAEEMTEEEYLKLVRGG